MAFLVNFVSHFGLMPVVAAPMGKGRAGLGVGGEPGPGATGYLQGQGLPGISLPKSEGSGLPGDTGTLRVISQRVCPGPFLSMSEKAHMILNWASGSVIVLFLSF